MKQHCICRVTLRVYSRSADELDDVDNALCNELDYWMTEMGFVIAALGEDRTEITPGSPDYAEAIGRLEEQEEAWKDEELHPSLGSVLAQKEENDAIAR